MDSIQWGGPFMTVDRAAKKPVRGRVFGRFEGNIPDDAAGELKVRILQSFTDTLASHKGPLPELLADKEALAHATYATLEPLLGALNVTGTLSIDGATT